MVNYEQWNIQLDKAIEIGHNNIKQILIENNKPILLSKLVTLLNNKTKNISFHNNKKLNCFSKFMKYNYGGILKFIDDYNIYGVINEKNIVKIVLLEDTNNIYKIDNDEWILL